MELSLGTLNNIYQFVLGFCRVPIIIPSIYTNAQYADMVFLYSSCNGNVNAGREYSRRFPNRTLPLKSVFSSTFHRLTETGSFAIIPLAGSISPPPLRYEERCGTILQYFDESTSESLLRPVTKLNVTPSAIWRTLNTDRRYSNHYQSVQNLLPQEEVIFQIGI